MTLLDDLGALDLSGVVDAKADISIAIDTEDLRALVGSGAVGAVLGEVGTAVEAALAAVEDPESLLEPLADLLAELLERLGAGVDVGAYADAVAAAARTLAPLLEMLGGDPNRIGFGGLDVGGALERVAGGFGDHAAAVSGGLSRARALIATVEEGLPSDPAALGAAAVEILVPLPTGAIDTARAWAARLSGALDAVAIDASLTSGLVTALEEVQLAAQSGDQARLEAALGALARVRAATASQLAAALRAVASAMTRLRVGEDGVAALRAVRGALAGADQTVIDVLGDWRDMIAGLREMVEGIDAAQAVAGLEEILDRVEARAREVLLGAIDASVEAASGWLRDLLREIPLREARAQVSGAIAAAASAVADADLDAPVEAVRGVLAQAASILADADPAALVQAAVARLEDAIREAMDALADALGRITAAIDSVADQASEVLGRAVSGLRTFREALDQVAEAIEEAGIAQAGQEIADTLEELRVDVSDLLANAPVPDALRDVVGQLVETLESIDLEAAVGGPLREVAARLQVPESVAATVTEGLEAVADAVAALVPGAVIADLQGRMDAVLTEIGNLDLSELTGGLGDFLDQAASTVEELDVTALAAPLGDVFARAVAAVDRVHPRVLLAPAIDLYGQLLGGLPVPTPETITERAATVTSQAGGSVARAAAAPAARLVDPAATVGEATPTPEDPPSDLRPGDIVRLVGFLPARLREALAGLGPAAVEALAPVDALVSGTAVALREVRDRLLAVDAAARSAFDTALAPLAAAQVDAQLALRGSASVSAAGGSVDLDVSLALVASAGPGAMAAELAGERDLVAQRGAAVRSSLAGRTADDLEAAADLLTSLLPGALLSDLDALLAALDPEPIAAELDALFAAIVDAAPAFLETGGDALSGLLARITALIEDLGPGRLMQRYLGVIDVLREELALVDPGRLADELGEIHAEVKAALLAYDPLVIAADLDGLVARLATALRGLDPGALLPDLSGIAAQVARVEDILPVNALAGVGEQLTAVGEELRAIDVGGLLDAVNTLAPTTADAVAELIARVRDQIVALLRSIRYTSPSASASVSVGVST